MDSNDEQITIPVIKSYFNKISANGAFDDTFRTLLFKIPLDESYTYETDNGKVFNLKDDSGIVWKIKEETFLTALKEITNQEYSMNPYGVTHSIQRNATDMEKSEYEKSREAAITDAVKLYYEKISINGRVFEYMGGNFFEIPLDYSYNYTDFTIKDSSGKEWRISPSGFLEILKRITNQEYRISGTRLRRNPTGEEQRAYESAKQER